MINSVGNMYFSRNDVVAIYDGTMDTYLTGESHGMNVIDREIMLRSMRWLQRYNPLIRLYGFGVKENEIIEMRNEELKERMNFTLSQGQISEKIDSNGNYHESMLCMSHPDILMNPMEFESERNEVYRTHRLSVGIRRMGLVK